MVDETVSSELVCAPREAWYWKLGVSMNRCLTLGDGQLMQMSRIPTRVSLGVNE